MADLILTADLLDLTVAGVVLGRHSAWIPPKVVRAAFIGLADGRGADDFDYVAAGVGIKVPNQRAGRIVKYTRPDEQDYDLSTFPHEVAILQTLGDRHMAPPIHRIVYARNVVSQPLVRGVDGGYRPGPIRHDPVGAWGYEMADATMHPSGAAGVGDGGGADAASIAAMRALPIEGSEGAWGDVAKPGNVVNGYLVDVRRSAFDGFRHSHLVPAARIGGEAIDPAKTEIRALLGAVFDDGIEARVRRDCQFPAGERPEPYQDFFLVQYAVDVPAARIGGAWVPGSRRVRDRADLVGFDPQPGESVVDIGCQSGGFLQWSYLRQAVSSAGSEVVVGGRPVRREGGVVGEHVGIDIVPEYLAAARDLARAAKMRIDYRNVDVAADPGAAVRLVRTLLPPSPDHLLLMSMEKHIGETALWALVDGVGARHTYIETNAYVPAAGGPAGGKASIEAAVAARGGRYVGDSRDRNPRRLYRIDAA